MAVNESETLASTFLKLDTQAHHYKWLVAGIILLAEGTATFAGNSINLSIPRLMAAFGTDLAATQWVTTGFLITRTLIIPILGWMGAVLGNRNLFVAIMVGFVITSLGCGMATGLPMLVIFRMLQGLVIGPIEGLTAVILVQAFPSEQRGFAIGLRTIGWSAGHIISFTLGGYFLEEVSWRLVFFMGIPTALLSALLGFLVLPQLRESRGEPVDYPGLLALASFLVPLLLAISWGRDDTTTLSTLLLLGIMALIGGGLFVTRELVTPYPAVNLRLFMVPAFCIICGTAILNSMGLFGAQFMVPIFLQQVMGFTPFQAGLILVPALIISGLSGVVSGRVSDLMAPPIVVIAGTWALMWVFFGFSTFTSLTTVGVLVGYTILYRICMFGIFIPLTALNIEVLGPQQVRMGQGLLGVVRNIGASLGVTVTSVLFERRRISHQLTAYYAYDSSLPDHTVLVGGIKSYLHQGSIFGTGADRAALSAIKQQMDVAAIAGGFRDSFFLVACYFFLASLPMVLMLRRKDKSII